MRRRVAVLLGTLLGVLTVLTGWFVVQDHGARTAQGLALARATDTARFADLSILAFQTDRWGAVGQEMARFEQVHGVAVAVVDLEGRTLAASRPGLLGDGDAQRPDVARAIRRALAGAPAGPLPPIRPWSGGDYVAAQPVGADAQTLGAAVTISPVEPEAAAVRQYLLLVTAIGLLGLLLVVGAVALPLGRWVLHPLRLLERAAERVAGGDLDHPVRVRHATPELRSLAASFDRMVDGTRTLLARQDQFVTDASHELRNPLTALRLQIDLLELRLAGGPAAARAPLDAAVREVNRLSEVTEELLTLARAGVPTGGAEPVDPATVLRRTGQRWAGRLPGLTFESPAGPDVPALAARPQAVERVLDILLENVQLHAAGAPAVVRVCTGPPGPGPGRVVIEVADRGPGVGSAELPHVRTRFWRSARSANRPGSGLGVAIAEQLVAGSGGTLTVAHNEPSGLVVRTVWPVHPPA
ncbi:HAMP domain-containing sensor histidine kinase [Pseudonocardia kongjuensis]|uniref:Signal transduction histidine-protein kinase/phosphatase MprB n=1 Tax=Pseudonocardia kongjuensis TaxID=102227 RepID=A0ABN1Y5G2_9PSEU